MLVPALGYEEAKRRLNALNKEIQDSKYNEQQILEHIKELKTYALAVNEEYNGAVRKYGALGDKFIFEEIDTQSILDFPKVLSKNKK